MLCYCLHGVVCVGIVILTYVSPVLLLPSSLPCPWSFRPRRIHPTCPCHGCHQQSALRVSNQNMMTTMIPRASLVFKRAEHPKHQLHYDIFVVLVIPTCHRHRLEGPHFVRGQGDKNLGAQHDFFAFNDGLNPIFCRGVLHPTLRPRNIDMYQKGLAQVPAGCSSHIGR